MKVASNNINDSFANSLLQELEGAQSSSAAGLGGIGNTSNPLSNNAPQATGGQPNLGPGESVTIPNETSMPDYYQGQTNGCGSTSLAMIMSYLGVPTTQADVDGQIRRTNIFTNPTDILDYARSKGMNAEGYNNGSLDEIKSYIDKGIPVQTLITADGSGDISKMHYVAVTGYGNDANGNPYIQIHNSATGKTEQVPQAQFEQEWGSTPLGFNHYFNVIAKPPTELPPSRMDGIQGTLAAADGVANVTNGIDSLVQPNCVGDFVHGLFQFPAGIVETILGGIGAGVELGADWLKGEADKVPVLGDLVNPICDLFSGAGAALGDFTRGICSSVDDVGSEFGSLFDGNLSGFVGGLGNAVSDAASGVANAVGDAAKSVGNAVSDAASSVGDAISSVGDAIGSLF